MIRVKPMPFDLAEQDDLLARILELEDKLQASLKRYFRMVPRAGCAFQQAASLKLDEHKHVRRDYELAKQAAECETLREGLDGLGQGLGRFCQGLPGCECVI